MDRRPFSSSKSSKVLPFPAATYPRNDASSDHALYLPCQLQQPHTEEGIGYERAPVSSIDEVGSAVAVW